MTGQSFTYHGLCNTCVDSVQGEWIFMHLNKILIINQTLMMQTSVNNSHFMIFFPNLLHPKAGFWSFQLNLPKKLFQNMYAQLSNHYILLKTNFFVIGASDL